MMTHENERKLGEDMTCSAFPILDPQPGLDNRKERSSTNSLHTTVVMLMNYSNVEQDVSLLLENYKTFQLLNALIVCFALLCFAFDSSLSIRLGSSGLWICWLVAVVPDSDQERGLDKR